jgi:hypothetical protein
MGGSFRSKEEKRITENTEERREHRGPNADLGDFEMIHGKAEADSLRE